MASLQAKTDAVKSAVASFSTCTPATVVTLKELLLPEAEATQPTAQAVKKDPSSRRNANAVSRPESMSIRDRTALATHVVNVTLKSLAEAAKPAAQPAASKQANDVQTPSGRRALRRSMTAPSSPLQPKTLNRVATSPNISTKIARNPATTPSTACLATVECARVAFAALRSIKGSTRSDPADLQLENGMSALVGKLLALGMHDQALKELRILKKRLDDTTTKEKKSASAQSSNPSNVGELLEYSDAAIERGLPTIVACQLQVLKLLAATKKPSYIASAIPFLREKHPSSPLRLLPKLAARSEKDATKVARQIASLSQTLFSLAPGVSNKDDTTALEPRLSISTQAAFEVQMLALQAQLKWWKYAGHKANVDDELLAPFLRCSRSFSRRHQADEGLVHSMISTAFEELLQGLKSQGLDLCHASGSPAVSIYQLLGSTAHAARQYSHAYRWFRYLKTHLDPKQDPPIRIFAVSGRLMAAGLKLEELDVGMGDLVQEIIQGLDGSLSGTATDLSELLESLSSARRSTVGLLVKKLETPTRPSQEDHLDNLLRTFILRFPRFLRRWLGPSPGKDSTAKHILQFDQRRQLVLKSINQTLDAALMIVKCDIQAGSVEWPAMDEVLQDCASILSSTTDPTLSSSKREELGTYHIKISSLYFSWCTHLRKLQEQTKDVKKQILQSLSRSIDAVTDCTLVQKQKAQISTKLELFADLCKAAGRVEDAIRTLRAICRSMADDGVLSDIVSSLSSEPPAVAWHKDGAASTFSRALRSIAKLDKSWNDWTFFLPELERAAVLEHLMNMASALSGRGGAANMRDPAIAALLRIYNTGRYPIRRFRVLLHLFNQNLGNECELESLIPHIEETQAQAQAGAAEDIQLARFLPHLQALYTSLSILIQPENLQPDCGATNAVSLWTSMLAALQPQEDIHSVIDDPESLLDHLHATSQLADLRGANQLRISILNLSIAIVKALKISQDGRLVEQHCLLVTTYASVGQPSKGMVVLQLVEELIKDPSTSSGEVLVHLYLSQADYCTIVGKMDEAATWVAKARDVCAGPTSSWARSKDQITISTSVLHLLQSTVSLQSGDIEGALASIKSSVRLLSHDWAKLETSLANSDSDGAASEASLSGVDLEQAKGRAIGPKFWMLAYPLIRSLLQISTVYAHIGMLQETLYYADSAWKIAESTCSSFYMAKVLAWSGSVHFRAGNIDKALTSLDDAEKRMPLEPCAFRVELARQLGEFHQSRGDSDNAARFFNIAETTARLLNEQAQVVEVITHTNSTSRPVKEKKPSTRTASRGAKTVSKPAATTASRGRKQITASKEKPAELMKEPSRPLDVYQASLLAAIVLSRTIGCIYERDWSGALANLEHAKDLPKLFGTLSQEQVITATSLIGQSMEQMIVDPVFSVLQDSTISIPAVSGTAEKEVLGKAIIQQAPARKGRAAAATGRAASNDRSLPAFADALTQAHELLLQAHSTALSCSDSSTVRRISSLLQSTMIFLSATNSAKPKQAAQAIFASVASDLARNVAWRREWRTLQPAEGITVTSSAAKKPDARLSPDMAEFQKSYVDLIPASWNVVSISLSNNDHDLCITKYQRGHSPFILRLPLERANSRDADSEIFNYRQGRQELLNIIRLANETSHSARDFTAKGERGAWWAEREALDTRLKELLDTIETTWLGGFKGIFSQHERQTELLARFQKSFQKVLDGNLPSRSRKRSRKTPKESAVTLDPRILDLFIGLGDPADPDCDFDEAVNDLLYFVVDVLQFHGERNAYDEIDFDAMVVETYDALRGYHAAAKSGDGQVDNNAHTVLVLDKSLHVFPWESLPCLQGLAVSRVPSLECLRQLIEGMRGPEHILSDGGEDGGATEQPAGHYVSAKSGTYILNPSSDLKNTQAYFQPCFRSLRSWTGIVNRAPEEAEFERALADSDIVVYFGHGSGAQYVRGKTIRRLQKCKPATFLMGCSSAALTAAGEFECYGPVWNYMMAGCPAVVGTLWDVTDRDIDRFAGRTFEEWGLFPSGAFRERKKQAGAKCRGKGRAATSDGEGGDDSSEDEVSPEEATYGTRRSLAGAVAKARTACRLRYLNAAAVVLYGIPAYVLGSM
ncbi:hypothetical protein S40293_08134 [Stachybotrys chartarum IBT 40293]|nr:hypothetical protein S40293_08134 [Stachybotrys chartarum IBT 40293]